MNPRPRPFTSKILTGAALLAVAIAAIGFATSGQAAAPAPKPFRVGYNAWIGSIAYFVALEKGFFKEAGLDVQPKMFSAPGDTLQPLLAGDLDAALTTADSVLTVADKVPGQLKIVYLTDTSAGADAVLAKPDIKDVKGMKGKKVAATLGQCNHLLLLKALDKAGLTEKDIELVNMNPDDAGAAFAAGKIDVAVTWEPWLTQSASSGKGHVIFSTKETPNLILDVLAVSAKGAKAKPAETRAFLAALNRGHDFVKAHPEEAVAIAAKTLEQKPDDVKAMLPKVDLYGLSKNLEAMKGPAPKASMQVAKFFKEKKVNDTVVDVNTLFDPAFLK
jgi:NitT/TauT family transport system substrate-binding protein